MSNPSLKHVKKRVRKAKSVKVRDLWDCRSGGIYESRKKYKADKEDDENGERQ